MIIYGYEKLVRIMPTSRIPQKYLKKTAVATPIYIINKTKATIPKIMMLITPPII
jgi:hypothetical protein